MNKERANIEWVSVSSVIPNPLNPRKNDAVNTNEMQNIIRKRGWEEPLTVYKKGKYFVVLSGHRRLHSAKEVGIKEVPVYIVEKPLDHQEEIERIASLQSGRVDWTAYEWARFTYDRWLAWGKPTLYKFAKQLNLKVSTVDRDIKVLDYYPREEIDRGLISGELNLTVLHALINWLNQAQIYKSEVIEDMGIDMIRFVMVGKAREGLIVKSSLQQSDFVRLCTNEEFRDFILSSQKHLSDAIRELGLEPKVKKSFHGYLVTFGQVKGTIDSFDPQSIEEKKKALESLQVLQQRINSKLNTISRDLEKEANLQNLDLFELK